MKVHVIHVAALALIACGPKSEQAEAPPAAPVAEPSAAHADHAAAAAVAMELPAVPAGAKVAFIAPLDGAVIEGPLENGKIAVAVKMTAEGIATKPAGPVEAGSGHHHIVVDGDPAPAGMIVPKDETHLHFGKAETEATLALSPGPHTIGLQFADGIHRSYGPQLAATVKITTVPVGTAEKPPKSTALENGEGKKESKKHKPGHKTHKHQPRGE
jgi:hypothetical protein